MNVEMSNVKIIFIASIFSLLRGTRKITIEMEAIHGKIVCIGVNLFKTNSMRNEGKEWCNEISILIVGFGKKLWKWNDLNAKCVQISQSVKILNPFQFIFPTQWKIRKCRVIWVDRLIRKIFKKNRSFIFFVPFLSMAPFHWSISFIFPNCIDCYRRGLYTGLFFWLVEHVFKLSFFTDIVISHFTPYNNGHKYQCLCFTWILDIICNAAIHNHQPSPT